MFSQIERRNSTSKENEIRGVLQRTVREGIPIGKQARRVTDNILEINQNANRELLRLAEIEEIYESSASSTETSEVQKITAEIEEIYESSASSTETSEVQKITIENVEAFAVENYEAALNGLYTFEIIDKKSDIPNLQKLQESLKVHFAKSENEEQLKIMKTFKEPVFLLLPKGVKRASLVESINSHKIGRIKGGIWKSKNIQKIFNHVDKQDKNTKWKIGITEGESSTKELKGDNVKNTFRERIKWFKEKYGSKRIQSIGILEYLILKMHILANKNEKILDDFFGKDNTSTIFELDNNLVYGSYFDAYSARILLFSNSPDIAHSYARFRRLVLIDVLF